MAKSRKNRKSSRRRDLKSNIVVVLIAVGILGIIGLIIARETKGGVGTEVAVLRSDHVNDGDPVESPSDPPTSGSHYASPMPAGFYTEDSPEYLSGDSDGYLIHSLEHGYVIFWYNCNLLDQQGCDDLKANIQETMDSFNGYKLIAFPRPSISSPLIMTAWGYMQEFNSYDAALAKKFIKVNQPLAPEPNAD